MAFRFRSSNLNGSGTTSGLPDGLAAQKFRDFVRFKIKDFPEDCYGVGAKSGRIAVPLCWALLQLDWVARDLCRAPGTVTQVQNHVAVAQLRIMHGAVERVHD